jgi:hypothetical protein
MNFLGWISIGNQVLGLVGQAVQLIERPGNGKLKRELAIRTVSTAINVAIQASGNEPLAPQDQDALGHLIGRTVDDYVDFFNRIGQFQQSQPAEIPPPAGPPVIRAVR